jgi:hypothetical protein
MTWTISEIEALARRRGLTRLTPEHLAQFLAAANAQPDTTALRDAVARKEDEPAYGPEAFAIPNSTEK